MVRTVGGAAADLLLDTYTGAAAAYSVRKLDKDYTGYCMKVRRASDDAEADIGFDGSGNLDTSAIATHCGASSGFVSVWYDMSGNANNATQSTAGNQPQIYNGTAVITENGKPALDFDGANMVNAASATQPNTIFHTHTWPLQDGAFYVLFDGLASGNRQGMGVDSDLGVRLFADSGIYGTDPMTAGDQTISSCLFNGGSSTLHLNGSAVSGIVTGTQGVNGHTIGSTFNNALKANRKHQEFIMYDSDQSSNRTGIETDIDTYFSIT
jgi:hypothetical protein